MNNGNTTGIDSGWSSQDHSDPNHTEWVASYTSYQNPGGSGQTFDFYPVAARYVKVTVTKLGMEVPESYAFQLSELEIY